MKQSGNKCILIGACTPVLPIFLKTSQETQLQTTKGSVIDFFASKTILIFFFFRLEHLGDAVLQLAVTQLLQESYPCLRVGPATVSVDCLFRDVTIQRYSQKIRSLAVGNGTLADM